MQEKQIAAELESVVGNQLAEKEIQSAKKEIQSAEKAADNNLPRE